MDIKPPFGYNDVAPLNRNQKVRLLAPGEVPAFARGLNSIPISYTEFALVAREYPESRRAVAITLRVSLSTRHACQRGRACSPAHRG